MKPGVRIALQATIAVVVMLGVAAVALHVSKRRAFSRADDFCAAHPAGTPARDVTIHALDRHVQVRTDLEPGALVVRFEAWGSSAAGECHLGLQGDYVNAVRVVRVP